MLLPVLGWWDSRKQLDTLNLWVLLYVMLQPLKQQAAMEFFPAKPKHRLSHGNFGWEYHFGGPSVHHHVLFNSLCLEIGGEVSFVEYDSLLQH